jgi:hypothetical protein
MFVNHPGVQIVPFHWGHAYAMDLRPFDANYFDAVPNFREMLRQYQETGNARSAVVGGKILCSFGYVLMWPSVAEMWMLTDNQIASHPVALTRSAQRYINHVASDANLKRLQITVNAKHDLALRWADALKFNREGVLHNYGADSADYVMFARYF